MRTAELRRLHKRIWTHLQTVECKGVVPNPRAAELLQGVRDSIKLCSFYFYLTPITIYRICFDGFMLSMPH